jgi:hypothetical protein
VSIKRRLRMLFLCLPLLLGAFAGMPMRPEEIEELMHSTNRQRITYTIPDGEDEQNDRKLPPLDSLRP